VGTGFLISAGEPTENDTVKYLTKHIAYVFRKFHINLLSSVIHDMYVYRPFEFHKLCSGLKTAKIEKIKRPFRHKTLTKLLYFSSSDEPL